jgi:hypothetical protein
MTFRLTSVAAEDGTLLRIDGQLTRDGLEELEHACRSAARPLTLDLAGLRMADDKMLEALVRLREAGARLVGASQFLELQLAALRRVP